MFRLADDGEPKVRLSFIWASENIATNTPDVYRDHLFDVSIVITKVGGDGKYSKTVVCPDGCVIFKLTAKPLGNENFHTGGFWDYPDETQKQ